MVSSIELRVPEDNKLLAALGRLAVAHGNMEMVLVMCVKSIESISLKTVLKDFRKKSAANLRQRIEWAAANTFESDDDKKEVKTLLHEARCASDQRNDLLHCFWGKNNDGDWRCSGNENNWKKLPQVEVINELVNATINITRKLNESRQKDCGVICRLAKQRGGRTE